MEANKHVSASPQHSFKRQPQASFKSSPRAKRKITTAKPNRLPFDAGGAFTEGQNLANYFPSEFGGGAPTQHA